MRRIPENEIESDFEREVCWGDEQRYLHNPNRRKASVFGFFLRLDEVLGLVRKHAPGKRVADLACAQGTFGLLLAEAGFDVTGVDIHPGFLKYANKKYVTGQYRTVEGNLMEFRDAAGFDCVLAGEVIEHVAYPRELLASVRENLRAGGVGIITTPNGNEWGSELPTFSQVSDLTELIPRQFHWGDHLFLYTADELRVLIQEAGLEVVELGKYNSSYVSQIKGLRYLLPLPILRWLERCTRNWPKMGKDSANLLIAVVRKPYAVNA